VFLTKLGLLVLRVVTGAALVAHGYPKLFGGEGRSAPDFMNRLFGSNYPEAVTTSSREKFAQGLESMGVPNPQAAAVVSGLAEFGGGLALIAGFMTRFAALAVIVNMLVAIRKAHWSTGFYGRGGYELAAQLGAGATTLLLAGPGLLSLDGIFRRGSKKAKEAKS